MHFLLLNQFYPPDPAPTGWYLHDLARTLVQRGHVVRAICSRRSYDGASTYSRREVLDGVDVVRLPAAGFGRRSYAGKLLDYASFYGSLLLVLLLKQPPPNLVLSLTTPPYLGLLGKAAAWRLRCQHAHWIMDLYPDVMSAHGMVHNHPLVFRALQRLTRLQFRRAGHVLALGPRMVEKVAGYVRNGAGPGARLSWVPLWCDPMLEPWPEGKANPLRAQRGWADSEPVFLYSGNMGLGHRLNEFLEAARRLGPAGPRWVFAGGGKRRGEVESFIQANPQARVDLLGYVPHDQLREHLGSGDVLLASLDRAWEGLMVPSKIQNSFAVGRPVLYVGGRESETADWIRESGGGWLVEENDLNGMLRAVQQAMDPEQRRRRGRAALDYARAHFSMETNCTRLAEMLEESSI